MKNIKLYRGDCLWAMSKLKAQGIKIDATITDPPYGVGLGVKTNKKLRGVGHRYAKSKSEGYRSYDDTLENFVGMIIPRLNEAIDMAKRACVFSSTTNIWEQRKASALGGIYNPGAVGWSAWGPKEFLPILFYGKPHKRRSVVLRSGAVANNQLNHPCPKPLEWMLWVVKLVTLPGETVFDPFMGSGTTGVACKMLRRKFIGVELDKDYFQIAKNRIAESVIDYDGDFRSLRSLWKRAAEDKNGSEQP